VAEGRPTCRVTGDVPNAYLFQCLSVPMFIYGAALRGTPVQVNVIGTVMFLIAILAVAVGPTIASRRSKYRW